MAWFTFPAVGAPGQQDWLMAEGGRFQGNRLVFDQVYTTRGGRWGAAFDPAQITRALWGTVEFAFLDCNQATVQFSGPASHGSGSMNVQRLTAIDQLTCQGPRDINASGSRALSGLRATSDHIEKIGIERTWQAIDRADVVLLLVDARAGIGVAELEIIAQLPPQIARITIFNKIDLTGTPPERREEAAGPTICLSAKSGKGIDLLREELLHIAGWHPAEDVFIARKRHLLALHATRQHIDAAQNCLSSLELFAEELRLAQNALSSITGAYTADDLLGEIFGRFCIGK
jgi:hypothetical protein